MPYQIDKDRQAMLIASIQRFFAEQLEEEIGDLKARLVLEFFLKELGPCVYNQAISDAQTRIGQVIADLDGSLFQSEFTYWGK